MKSQLKDLEIMEGDWDLFTALEPKEQVEFLFDATQIGTEASAMKQLDQMAKYLNLNVPPIVETRDINVGVSKLCITILKDEIHLNSNNLRAIRRFVSKLWNDGMLLSKLNIKKTEFDILKYFKAYKIIGRGYPISPN
jgi:spore cortex formation protein SpoVR/YcgB (stage V sporulation)